MKKSSLVILVIFFTAIQTIFAITRTWTGAISSSWSEADNWNPQGLPMDGDSVIISNASVVYDVSDEIEWLKVINGTLTINANTTLTLFESFSQKNAIILESSELINNGTVFLESSSEKGIEVGLASVLDNNGHIQINPTSRDGLTNMGIVNNSGMISISQIESSGALENDGTFNNEDSGFIVLADNDGSGVVNYIDANIFNWGSMRISNCDGTGIENDGIIINHDSLIITNQINPIENNDSIFIAAGGTLTIIDAVVESNSAIMNNSEASFINHGKISMTNVSRYAINNDSGRFNNYDSIIVVQAMDGIRNSFSKVTRPTVDFLNAETGYISISSVTDEAINNRSFFNNKGKIIISTVDGPSIWNTGKIINEGLIDITTAFAGINNNDSLINVQGGIIQMDQIYGVDDPGEFRGHAINNKDCFFNDGVLQISQVTANALWNGSFAFMRIGATGSLEIEDVGDSPFTIEIPEPGFGFECLGVLDVRE